MAAPRSALQPGSAASAAGAAPARQLPSVVLATAGYDHTIRFWEAPSGLCYRTIQHADSQVNCLDIIPSKEYIAAAGNPHIRLYEVASSNPAPVSSYDGHTGNVTAIGFQREGQWMFSASEDSTVKLWDFRAPGFQREYVCHAPINTCVLHPNQAELITGDQNGGIRVWDLGMNTCSREVSPNGDAAVRSLTVAADGSLLVAANNKGNCFVWQLGATDTSTFEPIQQIEAHKTYILKAILSRDSRFLATASADKTIKLHRLHAPEGGKKEFKQDKVLIGHTRWVWDCAFSADGAYLVSGSSDNVARLWDISASETIRQYNGHHRAISALLLSDH